MSDQKKRPGTKGALAKFTLADKKRIQRIKKRSTALVHTELDQGDDDDNTLILQKLKQGGHDEKRSPQLMKMLKKQRQEAKVQRMKRKKSASQEGDGFKRQRRSAPAAGPVPTEAVGAITDLSSADGVNYACNGMTTIPGGSIMTMMHLQLLEDTTSEPIGEPTILTEFDNGEYLTASANGVVKNPKNGVKAHMIYTYVPFDTQVPVTKSVMAVATSNPATRPRVDDPVYKGASHDPSFVKIGLNRTTNQGQDCDYNFTNIVRDSNTGYPDCAIPIKGEVIFYSAIKTPLADNITGGIYIVKQEEGGAVGMNSDIVNYEGNFASYFKVLNPNDGGNILQWDFGGTGYDGGARFNQNPWSKNTPLVMNMSFTVHTESSNANGISIYINNDPVTPTSPINKAHVAPIQFAWGCLVAGTKITMANGRTKMVEKVNVGDLVKADLSGRVLKVQDTIWGMEKDPVVVINTDDKLDVAVTEDHPMITPDGVKLAKNLKVGDILSSSDGISVVTKASRVKYKGKVYNFNLVNPDGSNNPPIGNDNTTIFANGLLVGDNAMQRYFTKVERKKVGTILQRLPKEWHQDYLNHLKEQKKQKA